MAIVKMNKCTIFAFESQKQALLEKLQRFEGVQFINIQNEMIEDYDFLTKDCEDKRISDLLEKQIKVNFMLNLLDEHVPKEKGMKSIVKAKKNLSYSELKKIVEESKWEDVYQKLKEDDEKIISLRNENTKLLAEIDNLNQWKNFDASFSQLKKFNYCDSFIGTAPKNLFDGFIKEFNDKIDAAYFEKIEEVKDGINLVLIYHKNFTEKAEELIKNYGLNRAAFNYEDSPQSVIKKYSSKIEKNKKEESKIAEKIGGYVNRINELQCVFGYLESEIEKLKSSNNFVKTQKTVVLEGWVPKEVKGEFESIVKECCKDEYYIEFKEPEEGEEVPILLKNNSFAEPYEIITAMYSLPGYTEIDPTAILAPFFFVFFGMMLSDAGYGAVILISSILALKLLPLDKGSRKFMRLFRSISVSTIMWGVIYGSYFGDAPTLFMPVGIKPLWLDPSANPMSVLILATIMGIIHLYTGLGIKSYELIRKGKVLDALFDTGFWYLLLTGIIMMLAGPSVGMEALAPIGKYMAIFGAVGLLLTQGRESETIGGKIAGGIFGLYGITGYLGDVLSYSRLLALGLATGLIGSSFNLIIRLLGNGAAAWIIGTIIFLAGHIFNIAINVLGAYVHTCRLQYLEFFGKFYEGGGKAFNPLKHENKYINIIKD